MRCDVGRLRYVVMRKKRNELAAGHNFPRRSATLMGNVNLIQEHRIDLRSRIGL